MGGTGGETDGASWYRALRSVRCFGKWRSEGSRWCLEHRVGGLELLGDSSEGTALGLCMGLRGALLGIPNLSE